MEAACLKGVSLIFRQGIEENRENPLSLAEACMKTGSGSFIVSCESEVFILQDHVRCTKSSDDKLAVEEWLWEYPSAYGNCTPVLKRTSRCEC